jgi:phosphatidyl-myo-inositol dimannoside synthase
MRLLALVTDGFGRSGGIARYNQDLMAALSQASAVAQVSVLPRFASATPALPAKVHQLAPSPGRATWSARALALAAQQRFDALVCGHLYALPLAAAIARLWRLPLWVQVHGIEAWQPHRRLCGLYRRSLAGAALVTSVSRYTRARVLAWSDLPPHRLRVLPNTVDARFAPRPRLPQPPGRPGLDDLAVRHGLEGRRILLTVGRLSAAERYKGHDRLIAALPAILAAVPDAAYLIVGDGDDRPRLERLAAESGAGARVVFAGHVPDGELPRYVALADAVAMPSTGEGFGIALIEAAAAGVPVIGGSRDGSVDALADGRIGRLVDPHDDAEVAAAVIDALAGRHPVADGAEQARRFAFDRFASHVDALVRSLAR